MHVLAAAMRCEKGDIGTNLSAHLRLLDRASSIGCDIVLYPEMSLSGSVNPTTHPQHLVPLDHPAVAQLVAATASAGVAACFGVAESSPAGPHIAQIVAVSGRILAIQRKRHLGEGEEAFAAATESVDVEIAGVHVAVAICAEAGFDAPFDHAHQSGASVVLFPAAPGLYGRRSDEASWRRGFAWWEASSLGDARRHASRCGLWIVLAGQAGSTLDEDFPGLAALVGPDGEVAKRLPDWNEGTLEVEIPVVRAPGEAVTRRRSHDRTRRTG